MNILRKVSNACRVFWHSPSTLVKHASEHVLAGVRSLITLDQLELYVWTHGMVGQPESRVEFEFRSLEPEDFARLRHRTDRFGEHARLYYYQRGISSAFGIFIGGEIAHISWVYTAEEYKREPYERFLLDRDEAEIVNVFTADVFRGLGLYPYAIRAVLSRLGTRGFKRVFINIEPDNNASRRGILKAGLSFYGRTWHLRSPIIRRWRGWYWRQVW